jgi:anti-sigma factor RsiW
MSENRVFLDHDLLVAYVDRELPPDRLAAVEAALLHDADAWEAVRLLRLSAKAAARAFAPVIDEPIPARLRAAAGGKAESGKFGAPRPRMRAGWPMALGASLAALAVGLGAGYSLRGITGGTAGGAYTPASDATADPLAARFESALLAALEKGVDGQSVSYESKDVGQGRVELGRAFTTGFGSDCREFHREETRASALSRADGLACRGADKGWSVMILPTAG